MPRTLITETGAASSLEQGTAFYEHVHGRVESVGDHPPMQTRDHLPQTFGEHQGSGKLAREGAAQMKVPVTGGRRLPL